MSQRGWWDTFEIVLHRSVFYSSILEVCATWCIILGYRVRGEGIHEAENIGGGHR